MRRVLGQEAAARNAAPVGLGEEMGDGAAARHRYRRRLGMLQLDGGHINLDMIEARLTEVYRGPESGNPYTP
jgi:hypothetical protein